MFKYTWKNNVNAGNPVSAAKPTVEVTYVGTSDQYNGTVVTYFTIEPCSLSYYDLDITIPNQTTSNTDVYKRQVMISVWENVCDEEIRKGLLWRNCW